MVVIGFRFPGCSERFLGPRWVLCWLVWTAAGVLSVLLKADMSMPDLRCIDGSLEVPLNCYHSKAPNHSTYSRDEIHFVCFAPLSFNQALHHYWIFHVKYSLSFKLLFKIPALHKPHLTSVARRVNTTSICNSYFSALDGWSPRLVHFNSSAMHCVQLQQSINK